ncbi:hypothetical protein VRB21_18980 [Pseudomonas poae]
MADYAKSGLKGYFKMLAGEKFESARKHSPRSLADAMKSGDRNPSTEIHLLMDEFEALSKPKAL